MRLSAMSAQPDELRTAGNVGALMPAMLAHGEPNESPAVDSWRNYAPAATSAPVPVSLSNQVRLRSWKGDVPFVYRYSAFRSTRRNLTANESTVRHDRHAVSQSRGGALPGSSTKKNTCRVGR